MVFTAKTPDELKAFIVVLKEELKDHDVVLDVTWKLKKDPETKVQANSLGWVIRCDENLDKAGIDLTVRWKTGEDKDKDFALIKTEWDFPNRDCEYSAITYTSTPRMPDGRPSKERKHQEEDIDDGFDVELPYDRFKPATWARWINAAAEGDTFAIENLSSKLMTPVDGYKIDKAEGHRTRLFRVIELYNDTAAGYGQGWDDPDTPFGKLGVGLATLMRDLINDEDKVVDTDELHARVNAVRQGKAGDDYATVQAAMVAENKKNDRGRGCGGGKDKRTDAERKAICRNCGLRGHYQGNCRKPKDAGAQDPANPGRRQDFRKRGTGAVATTPTVTGVVKT